MANVCLALKQTPKPGLKSSVGNISDCGLEYSKSAMKQFCKAISHSLPQQSCQWSTATPVSGVGSLSLQPLLVWNSISSCFKLAPKMSYTLVFITVGLSTGHWSHIIKVFKSLTEWHSVHMLVCAYWNHLRWLMTSSLGSVLLKYFLLEHLGGQSPCTVSEHSHCSEVPVYGTFR